jgi:hypothetical protein
MTYVPSFIQIDSGIQTLIARDSQTHRENGYKPKLMRVITSCFRFTKMCLCQVSLLSRCSLRYLTSSFWGSWTLFIWTRGHDWLPWRKWKLSTNNKHLLYKAIPKPIWTYGIQLWGTASTSNIEILERFQSKTLYMIVDAPWYVPNTVIRRDLQIPTVKEEIQRYSSQYSARLSAYPNYLIANLMELYTCQMICLPDS